MKSFTDRVKRDQEKHEGMHVFKVSKEIRPLEREPIDLICMKNGKTTFIRASGSGHGHLNRMMEMQMRQLGKKCHARVLHASINGENSIVFKIVYERK